MMAVEGADSAPVVYAAAFAAQVVFRHNGVDVADGGSVDIGCCNKDNVGVEDEFPGETRSSFPGVDCDMHWLERRKD